MCLAEFSEGGAGHRLCEKPEFSHSKWEFHTKDIVQDFRGSCVTFRDTPAVLFYQLTLEHAGFGLITCTYFIITSIISL